MPYRLVLMGGLLLATMLASCHDDEADIRLFPVGITPASTPSTGAFDGIQDGRPSLPIRPEGGIDGPQGALDSTGRAPSGVNSTPLTLTWTAPPQWIARPPASVMRLAQWELVGQADGQSAECAIFHFEGGGTVEQNVSRWLSQFSQADGGSTSERAVIRDLDRDGMPLRMVLARGTYLGQAQMMGGPVEPRADWALLGAIIGTQRSWFVKCVGPESTIMAERDRIEAFFMSFRPVDDPG